MSTSDDFFGDSKTAVKECSFCGKQDGDLIVSIRDAYGPTHWHHAECKQARMEARERELAENQKRNHYVSEWEARGSKNGE